MSTTRAIICAENQDITLEDIKLPELRAKDILVKNTCTGISLGTELMLIRHKVSWGPYPIWLGYQAVGIVESVGSKIDSFKAGDKVYHRGSSVPAKLDGQQVTPTSGAHGSYSVVDTTNQTHGAALLPENIDEEAASLFVMPSVGLNGVNLSGVKTGDIVVIQGAGLVGLGNTAAAKLRGATVIVIDLQANRLEVARQIGADYTINADEENVPQRLAQLAQNDPDVVFESTGLMQYIDTALSYCKMHGKFVFQGDYGQFGQLSFNFYSAHEKLLTTYFPSEDGYQPCRKAIMDWISRGAIKWSETITHRLSPEESPAFYRKIIGGDVQDVIGAVIKWR